MEVLHEVSIEFGGTKEFIEEKLEPWNYNTDRNST